MTSHDHPLEGDCLPSCPAWAEGVLELSALRRRHDAMLAACRAADHVEFVIVAPATPGAQLPDFLQREEFVRLNLVVGRDCPEVMLDEAGIQVTLTFRGRRHDCVLPWEAVKGGLLAPQRKRARRFGVVAGGAEAAPEGPARTPTAALTAVPRPTSDPEPRETPTPAPASDPASTSTSDPARAEPRAPAPTPPRPRTPFGVILGGRSEEKD